MIQRKEEIDKKYMFGPNLLTFDFRTNKYSREVLVDVATTDSMSSFIKSSLPHILNFYDITLITGGSGCFWLDSTRYQVRPNQLLFTTPGQIRRWYAKDLQAICFFFSAKFFLNAFNDPLLLHRLQYFHTKVGPGELLLNENDAELILGLLGDMQKELNRLQPDSQKILLASAYYLLLRLERFYIQSWGKTQVNYVDKRIGKFRQLLEKYYSTHHKVASYADMLAVTPGHLNYLCKRNLGCNASELVTSRIFTEAKIRLTHTNTLIETIAYDLGFENTSYFCRAFKKITGCTPSQYRKLHIEESYTDTY
ncbi:AraC family transcriptional regulator [Alteromonas sediminis]|uniref:AraC family transcriptional regulator n=1 Tax=Alteromonas sediminis TaxID=2259342 RepID=A0A3N5Y556_9ALTE|nr:helix-turn-helix transcriptional regulator [Alteromonas sediminis]RPJ68126.1 AraC family transcriptional regulator [Alteromonas sediminis]